MILAHTASKDIQCRARLTKKGEQDEIFYNKQKVASSPPYFAVQQTR
jgi:hypothetical protein